MEPEELIFLKNFFEEEDFIHFIIQTMALVALSVITKCFFIFFSEIYMYFSAMFLYLFSIVETANAEELHL